MITLAIFDMAGTTINEQNIVYQTLHKSLTHAGYTIDFPQVLAMAAGKEKQQAIRDALAHLQGKDANKDEVQTVYQHFQQQLAAAYQAYTPTPMPYAEALFRQLQSENIRVVLNTGYDRPTADALLTKLGWHHSSWIDLTLTADDVARGRPHPAMIHKAMQYFGIADSQQVAKTGDSVVDIEEGQQAGCGMVVGITTGAHTAEQLRAAAPTHIIHSLKDFLPLIRSARQTMLP